MCVWGGGRGAIPAEVAVKPALPPNMSMSLEAVTGTSINLNERTVLCGVCTLASLDHRGSYARPRGVEERAVISLHITDSASTALRWGPCVFVAPRCEKDVT